jgi:hypothetical protein
MLGQITAWPVAQNMTAQLQPANTMSTASRRASNPAGARGLAIAAGSTSPEPA